MADGTTPTATGTWDDGSASGTFTPDATDPNAIYTPAVADRNDNVTLTYTIADPDGAGPCMGTTSTVVVHNRHSAVSAVIGTRVEAQIRNLFALAQPWV